MISQRARRLAAAIVIATLAVTVPAGGATKNGITPKAPKKGAKIDVGSRPVFKGRVNGPGKIFVYVSKSRKRDGDGLIGGDQMNQKAKRTSKSFRTKAKFNDFPEFWLNSPGTYYWQAFRTLCTVGNTDDCSLESPITKIKVR